MPKLSRSLLACACALAGPLALRAEPAVIGLARAYLGPDSTLDGITSIHFVGSLDRLDAEHPDKGTVHASLDMIFVKPLAAAPGRAREQGHRDHGPRRL
jgi:hypothetical protein